MIILVLNERGETAMNMFRPIQLPNEYRSNYADYCSRHNRVMFFPLAAAILIIEVIILIFQMHRLGDLLFGILYYKVYVIAIIISGIFTIIYGMYKLGKLKKHQQIVDMVFIGCLLGLALMTSVAETISMAELPHNVIFSCMMIVTAAIVYLDYKSTIMILIVGNLFGVLISSAPVIIGGLIAYETDLYTVLLDMLFVFIATLFICIPCYNNRTNMFLQEIALAQTNQDLTGTNEKLATINKQLAKTSLTDGLTGISNRAAFNQVLPTLYNNARDMKESLSILMIDIDYFKQYNDIFGHVAGDRCLRQVADIIKDTVRSDFDNVFRYGGEEFAVLLPHTSQAAATHIAQRILENIRKNAIPHHEEFKIVTVSIGVVGEIPTDTNEYEIIEKADSALYQAKNTSRDRLVVYSYSK